MFWIVDNGSAHRGQRSTRAGSTRWRIFFSILQRKVLTPNDYENLAVLTRTLNQVEHHWNEVAEPFEWNFTRDDLAELMNRLAPHEPELRLAA